MVAPSTGGIPQITLAIQDATYQAVATNTIGNDQNYYAVARVVDSSSNAVANALVHFSVSDASAGTLLNNVAITDVNGYAKVQLAPTSYSSGVATLTATSTVGTAATPLASLNFQTAATTVTLDNMTIAPASLSAYQNALVTVNARLPSASGTASAPSGKVTASFFASCGTFSPPSKDTDQYGQIKTTFIPGGSCSGLIPVTATVVGQSSVSKSQNVTVSAAAPMTVNFVGASVPYLVSQSVGGPYSRSVLTFQLLDDQGRSNTMAGNALTATLSPSSKAAGITFADGSQNDQPLTTSADGSATVTVVAGNLFSSVLVTATYSAPGQGPISATSYGVAVTSGKASQDRFSISATALSLEAWHVDGVATTIAVRVSDRLGNPLPKGTLVNFASNNGVINGVSATGAFSRGVCELSDQSVCNVTYTSTNGTSLPANGRVAILAYMSGEESFVDSNGDNLWQPGETFYPIGRPYLDANEDAGWGTNEQLFGTSNSFTGACDPSGYPSKENTCDTNAWNGDVLVRKQIIIVQATSDAKISQVSRSLRALVVKISDSNPIYNNNSMPTGSTISATVTPVTNGSCALVSVSDNRIRNTINAMNMSVFLNGAADCPAATIAVTVTTPGGASTTVPF